MSRARHLRLVQPGEIADRAAAPRRILEAFERLDTEQRAAALSHLLEACDGLALFSALAITDRRVLSAMRANLQEV